MKYLNDDIVTFLSESNYIESEPSQDALEDAIKSWKFAEKRYGRTMELNTVLKIHHLLMKRLNWRIAGRLRDVDVMVGWRRCIPHLEVERELQNWIKIYNGMMEANEEAPPQKKGTVAKNMHILFEEIHPFEDGNGRTGRILMNIQRLKFGLPIKIIYEKDKHEYYKWFAKLR